MFGPLSAVTSPWWPGATFLPHARMERRLLDWDLRFLYYAPQEQWYVFRLPPALRLRLRPMSPPGNASQENPRAGIHIPSMRSANKQECKTQE